MFINLSNVIFCKFLLCVIKNCDLFKHLKDKSDNNNQTFMQFDHNKKKYITRLDH